MIDFRNISKSFSGEYLLKDVTFRINPGERVGIVGPNGAGKSTIFGIITGAISPDSGSVIIPNHHRLGIMKQRFESQDLDTTLLEFTADAIPELRKYSAELSELEEKLQHPELYPNSDSLLRRHGELQSTIEHLGAYSLDQEAKEALSNLGFPVKSFDRPLKEFSGGWQMRAALARVLISHPDILMLDEPSNYLDVPAVEWMCRFLNTFPGTLLLISHDRFLLRKLASTTLEINAGTATRYAGGYDFYRLERENRRKRLEAEKRNVDRRKEHLERVIDRFRAKSSKAAAAKSWQKQLDRIEDVTLPDNLEYHGVLRFPKPPDNGTEAARFENITFGYEPEKILIRDFDLSIDAGDRIAVVGYNGMGKTTLLKLLTGALKPLNGRVVIGHHSVIGYQAQEFRELANDELTVWDVVRGNLPPGASTAPINQVLGSFGFSGDAVNKPCGVLSGGERIRLQFARIFVNPPNLLVLDEPTTHLDLAARELLQQAICDYSGTVVLVSHDIEFIRATAKTILALESTTPRKYFGNYDYYLEKSRQLNGSSPAAASSAAPAPGENTDLAKDRRRARAQARQALSGDLRKAKERVSTIESALDEKSERRKVLVAQLSSGMKIDFAAVNRELAQLEKELVQIEEDWELATADLEALKLENERIHR